MIFTLVGVVFMRLSGGMLDVRRHRLIVRNNESSFIVKKTVLILKIIVLLTSSVIRSYKYGIALSIFSLYNLIKSFHCSHLFKLFHYQPSIMRVVFGYGSAVDATGVADAFWDECDGFNDYIGTD